MAVLMRLNTAADFWLEMVEPDCDDYFADETNLRRALHAAISLFHMSDWVFHTHETQVRSAFTFTDPNGKVRTVSKLEDFADALEQRNADFGRIRGIAHAAKHLKLRKVRPVPNAPSHAANTAIQAEFVGADACGCQQGGYGWLETGSSQAQYGASTRVVLAGPNGNDMEFSNILRSVYGMWKTLKSTHGW
jgi:hypothetical protein